MKRLLLLIVALLLLFCTIAVADTLKLPAGTKVIEEEAFMEDTSIDEVVLPEGVTGIGERAFAGSSLTEIKLPVSLTSIAEDALPEPRAVVVSAQSGSWAWQWAVDHGYMFSDWALGDGTTMITKYLARDSDVLIPTDINGKRVIAVGCYVFEGRNDLTSVTIPSTVTEISQQAFHNCDSLTSIVIPEGVTTIKNYAFLDCNGLTSVTLPASLNSIGDYAFYGCEALTEMQTPEGSYAETWAFMHGFGDSPFAFSTLDDGTLQLMEYHPDKADRTDIVIPASVAGMSVTKIGYEAFYDCDSLTSVTIPDTVTEISFGAFAYCNGLTSVVIPEGVTNIGDSAFCNCKNLTSVVIPEGVTSIGYQTFSGCFSLTSVTIPDTIKEICNMAFYDCDSLTSVVIPEGVTSIGHDAFESCNGLASVTLPKSLTSIDDYAFYDCGAVTEMLTPEGSYAETWALLHGFGDSPFAFSILNDETLELMEYRSNREDSTDIVIPESVFGISVTSIGNEAFCDCNNLTSVTLPGTLISIGNEAFYGCDSLTSIDIPEGVTNIGDRAFADMPSLKTITLPESVADFGDRIFAGATDALLVKCVPDSAAMIYTQINQMDYDADTTCRALIIGINYEGSSSTLNGPDRDAMNVKSALSQLKGREYESTVLLNPTKADFDQYIDKTFIDAKAQDISVFYYSGHGNRGGVLMTQDSQYISPYALKAKLDTIPGRKILLIDCCYSGAMIQDSDTGEAIAKGSANRAEVAAQELEAFNKAFIAAFSQKPVSKFGVSTQSRAAFTEQDYFVLTASRYDEKSESIVYRHEGIVTNAFGLFTYCMNMCCGWDSKNKTTMDVQGDEDGDGAVSLQEAFDFILMRSREFYEDNNWDADDCPQIQVYPENCVWFAPFRYAEIP